MGDDTWGSSCPGDRYVVDLNEDEVALFVDRHNFYRNKIALGKESGFSPSSLMATMIWDEELAYLAELNVRSNNLSLTKFLFKKITDKKL